MDTIRFRGKDKFGTWRYGFLLQDRSGYSALVPIQYPLLQWKINLENELKFVYTKTLGQFVGIKDKKDIDIYEGDICRAEFNGVQYKILVVRFGTGWYGTTESDGRCIIREILSSFKDIDKIGNIHDNPKLFIQSI